MQGLGQDIQMHGSCTAPPDWSRRSAGPSSCLVAEGSGSSRCRFHVCRTMLHEAAYKQSPDGCSQSSSCPRCRALILLQRLACMSATVCLNAALRQHKNAWCARPACRTSASVQIRPSPRPHQWVLPAPCMCSTLPTWGMQKWTAPMNGRMTAPRGELQPLRLGQTQAWLLRLLVML